MSGHGCSRFGCVRGHFSFVTGGFSNENSVGSHWELLQIEYDLNIFENLNLDCRGRSAVDYELAPGDSRGPVRRHERNEFCNFFGTSGTPKRNPAQRVH